MWLKTGILRSSPKHPTANLEKWNCITSWDILFYSQDVFYLIIAIFDVWHNLTPNNRGHARKFKGQQFLLFIYRSRDFMLTMLWIFISTMKNDFDASKKISFLLYQKVTFTDSIWGVLSFFSVLFLISPQTTSQPHRFTELFQLIQPIFMTSMTLTHTLYCLVHSSFLAITIFSVGFV